LADLTLGSSDIPQICTGKNVGFLIVRTVYWNFKKLKF
jgi:hypothetical protein